MLRDRAVAIQEKAIRHVRTPEGVRKYKQPIGSVIIRDPLRELSQRASDMLAVANERRTGVPRKSNDHKPVKLTWSKNTASTPDYERYSSTNESPYSATIVKSYNRDASITIKHRDSIIGDPYRRFGTIEQAKAYAEQTIGEHKAEREKQVPTRPRKHQNFWDAYSGVYGQDWHWGTKQDKDLDPNKPEDRKKLAEMDSKYLGITVNGLVRDHTPDQPELVNIEQHETINSMVHAYDSWYPGFMAFVPSFNIRPPSQPGENAHNQLWNRVFHYEGEPQILSDTPDRFDGVVRDYNYTTIGMNPEFFSYESGLDKIGNNIKNASRTGWWSVDYEEVKKTHPNLEDWQIGSMAVLHHEIGHTIGRIASGDITTQRVNGRKDMGNTHNPELHAILKKYGVAKVGNGVPGDTALYWNSKKAKEYLSEYGGKNMQEFLAEAWAAYMMNDKPNDLVVSVGQWMENALLDFLSKEYDA